MSNKTEAIRRGVDPGSILFGAGKIVAGVRSGKALAAVNLEVMDEMSVYPPATAAEAMRFCKSQLKRCRINLHNAETRKDERAVANLQRKLTVYEYLYKLAAQNQQGIIDGIHCCPNCQVTSMDGQMSFEGDICPCCGYKEGSNDEQS